MTDDDDRLRALFDETAEEPSREALDRMARAAAQIPERRAARFWGAWPRLAAALVGLAAVAGAAVIAMRDETPPATPIASAPDRPIVSEAPPEAEPLAEPLEPEERLAIVLDDDAWSEDALDATWLAAVGSDPLAALDGDDPLAALDVLLAFDEDDLDVLLASYERTLLDG